ncbi:hypothetical protein C8R47DRAFT_1066117 [Mycena vitilis]|nr:hypothetical protein C8R47DRAFT_1066117 [Mycena vitilis]
MSDPALDSSSPLIDRPRYVPDTDHKGGIRRFPSPPDLDFCIIRRAVRVGTLGAEAGLEFWRRTYLGLTPQPPILSSDGYVRPRFDMSRVVNKYIMPPLDYTSAVQAVAWATTGPQSALPLVTLSISGTIFLRNDIDREESAVDTDMHPDGLFCVAFLKSSGVYEAAFVLCAGGDPVISESSLIFAPSAWKHAAQVLQNCGNVTGNKHRLLCQLEWIAPTETVEIARLLGVSDREMSLRGQSNPTPAAGECWGSTDILRNVESEGREGRDTDSHIRPEGKNWGHGLPYDHRRPKEARPCSSLCGPRSRRYYVININIEMFCVLSQRGWHRGLHDASTTGFGYRGPVADNVTRGSPQKLEKNARLAIATQRAMLQHRAESIARRGRTQRICPHAEARRSFTNARPGSQVNVEEHEIRKLDYLTGTNQTQQRHAKTACATQSPRPQGLRREDKAKESRFAALRSATPRDLEQRQRDRGVQGPFHGGRWTLAEAITCGSLQRERKRERENARGAIPRQNG